jgi:hypothetical protein
MASDYTKASLHGGKPPSAGQAGIATLQRISIAYCIISIALHILISNNNGISGYRQQQLHADSRHNLVIAESSNTSRIQQSLNNLRMLV